MRIRLKGLNSITKRLADGTNRTYSYAWKGGPALHGEPGTAAFIASYNEAVARKVTPARGKLLSLLQDYQASEDFRSRADSTRRGYVALIRRIEQAFGDFPLSGLSDRRTRGIFMAWRDGLAVNAGRRLCMERARPGAVLGPRSLFGSRMTFRVRCGASTVGVRSERRRRACCRAGIRSSCRDADHHIHT